MIVIGYQGIGKSTLAKNGNGWIDLESSNFYVDGKRSEDWFRIYGNIAFDISKQGYNVMTPTHAVLRQYLGEGLRNIWKTFYLSECVCACYPCHDLKDRGIERLEHRYHYDMSEKNYRALMNAKDRFDDNIDEIESDCKKYDFVPVVIRDMNYNLKDLIDDTQKQWFIGRLPSFEPYSY